MATSTTMVVKDPFPRAPTPTPRVPSAFRLITKRTSYQSLRSPDLLSPMSPVAPRPFPAVEPPQESPGWEHINVISPSTASHHSMYSDSDDAFRSPRLALLTNNLLGSHMQQETEGIRTLISPSAPVQQPGDELLYDVGTEAAPDERYFHADFQAALAATKQEMKDISLAMWGCPASHRIGSDLHHLKQWAQNLSEFEPTRTRTVGLVGDPGVGKSSVINSLLDQSDLAHSSVDSGHSTPVITEYRYRPAHHDEPFGMEVDYMTTEEIRELIEELLRSFRACYIPAFHDIDNLEERQEIRTRSDKAWHTLNSMFRSQPIFTKDFVLQHTYDTEMPLVHIFEKWAAKFLTNRPGGFDARTWSSTAFNIDECRDKIDAFTSDPIDEDTAALWPFVRVVRVYLRAAVLQSGLVLVDCPSLRDLNFAREKATERYLRNCHQIFAVTTMKDALIDKGVLDIVKRNGRHRPLRIICTKSEDINVREVERSQPDISLQVRTWRQQIEGLQKQVKRCEAQRRHGVSGALEEETRSRDMLEDIEYGLKRFLVERRNCSVATQLIEKFAADVQHGDLKIFCVSNKDYFDHRYDEQIRAETRLDLSGILHLRKYCHSIPADAQFEAAAAFINHDVPAFLGSLKQWAVAGLGDMNAEKAEALKHLMQRLEETAIKKFILPTAQIHQTRSSLNQDFVTGIISPIKEHRSAWRKAALEKSKEWSKWDGKDYAAFCRHYGNHSSKDTGQQSWNDDLLAPMRDQLEGNWDFFHENVEERKRGLKLSIVTDFDEICQPLKERSTSPASPIQTLLSTIPHRISTIQHIIETNFSDLLEGTQQLETDALYGHVSSYISNLMSPAYHAAAILPSKSPVSPTTPISASASSPASSRASSRSSSPSTSPASSPTDNPSPELLDKQRKELITAHVVSSRLYSKLGTLIERSHRGFTSIVFSNIHAAISREIDALIRDMHLVVPPKDVLVNKLGAGGTGHTPNYSYNGGSPQESLENVIPVRGPSRDGGGTEEVEMVRGKSEAEQYADFAGRLKARIVLAERVVLGSREVVEGVRGMSFGEGGEGT
ncbi:hypothetical protein EJ04DRAFT_524428 [Polyplosphaeria fusca]|uniref:G domain-containing protein n=1 Tax=Polyplosphaeria fusca TaxID=682080 RepID=A0A9P4QW06_9PLEO|nr:hypothetical protein EJ04DRAFT_524428 [Polyplosphaeria fusca]